MWLEINIAITPFLSLPSFPPYSSPPACFLPVFLLRSSVKSVWYSIPLPITFVSKTKSMRSNRAQNSRTGYLPRQHGLHLGAKPPCWCCAAALLRSRVLARQTAICSTLRAWGTSAAIRSIAAARRAQQAQQGKRHQQQAAANLAHVTNATAQR